MNIQWNAVTWYSKLAAAILALLVFALGFYVGSEYGILRVSNTGVDSTEDVRESNQTETVSDKNVNEPSSIVLQPITNNNVSDWQTYRNEEFGFEFQYPNSVSIENISERDTFWVASSNYFLSAVDSESEDSRPAPYLFKIGQIVSEEPFHFEFGKPIIFRDLNGFYSYKSNSCPRYFNNNKSMPIATAGFSDGGWGERRYIFLLSQTKQLVIYTSTSEDFGPNYELSIKDEERTAEILSTLKFYGDIQPMPFKCVERNDSDYGFYGL